MSYFFFAQAKTFVKVAGDFAVCIFCLRVKLYLSADDTTKDLNSRRNQMSLLFWKRWMLLWTRRNVESNFLLFIYYLIWIKLALWVADSTQVNSKRYQFSRRFLVTANQWTPKWVISRVYSIYIYYYSGVRSMKQIKNYEESKIFFSKLQKRCSPFIQTEIYLITAAWLKRRLNWESAGLPSGKSRVKKPSRTNTQGLKITEEKVLPSQWLRLDFLGFSDKDEKTVGPVSQHFHCTICSCGT